MHLKVTMGVESISSWNNKLAHNRLAPMALFSVEHETMALVADPTYPYTGTRHARLRPYPIPR